VIGLVNSIINFRPYLINFIFTIKISSHNVISFNKLIELSLKISILLS
jgi:hypothetical protein